MTMMENIIERHVKWKQRFFFPHFSQKKISYISGNFYLFSLNLYASLDDKTNRPQQKVIWPKKIIILAKYTLFDSNKN